MNECKRNVLSAMVKKKKSYFCFNFWKKYKEKIALCENKKFEKVRFNPSKIFLAAQAWLTTLLGIHFRTIIPVS